LIEIPKSLLTPVEMFAWALWPLDTISQSQIKHGRLVQVSGSSFAAAFATGVEAIRRSRGTAHLEFRDLGLPQPEQGAGLIDALMTAVSFRPE
jgi:hypothetical protein